MPPARRPPPGTERPRPAAGACRHRRDAADHLPHRARRHSHVGSSHEGRCSRVSHEAVSRSEEHTSELQSRSDLVCRLLLEKKKISKYKSLSIIYNNVMYKQSC